MKPLLSIFKIGGNIIEDADELRRFLRSFSDYDGSKILVHGGGKKASQLLTTLGIKPQMVNGRRITDEATLEVVVMVYAGLINKRLVSQLQALGTNAIGMSGADANSIQAQKRPAHELDYGFVGDIDVVAANTLTHMLDLGLTPVFCALTHDDNGQLLNTNADTIASELAIALSTHFQKIVLNYCFEYHGVLKDVRDSDSIIPHINSQSYQELIANGIITQGMLPKLQNCFHALEQGVSEVRIGNLGLFDKTTANYTQLVL